ncbi:MAG: DUF2975 domain-containing protein [bacterium]|nr:DUF2975 domain-containing protein [bacterium]
MNEKRYHRLVTLCVYLLRAAMLLIAILLPVVMTIDNSILNRIISKAILRPRVYFYYELIYMEIVLGYLVSMFLNFRDKEIFVIENTGYLKRIGQLIIAKDFIYIPLNLIANQTLSINFNATAWMIGFILILFSELLAHGIQMAEEQKYTV